MPNDEGSHAGPVKLDAPRNELPALAGATGWTISSYHRRFLSEALKMTAARALQHMPGKGADAATWHLEELTTTMRTANLLVGGFILPRLEGLLRCLDPTLDCLD